MQYRADGTVSQYHENLNSDNPVQATYYDTSGNVTFVALDGYMKDSFSWGYTYGVDYKTNGEISYSYDYYPVDTQATYEYSNGTYVKKPQATKTDSNTWTYGTYTVGTNGDITRDDNVVLPGRSNYQTLCEAHPTEAQCNN